MSTHVIGSSLDEHELNVYLVQAERQQDSRSHSTSSHITTTATVSSSNWEGLWING